MYKTRIKSHFCEAIEIEILKYKREKEREIEPDTFLYLMKVRKILQNRNLTSKSSVYIRKDSM